MNTLTALIERVAFEHIAWHDACKLAVIRKWDGSWWVRWFVAGVLYEWPACDSSEALAIVGERLSADVGWRLL